MISPLGISVTVDLSGKGKTFEQRSFADYALLKEFIDDERASGNRCRIVWASDSRLVRRR